MNAAGGIASTCAGFNPENVELLAPPLRHHASTVTSLRLHEWAMNPKQLLEEGGALTFGRADGHATDAVLACALLASHAGATVRTSSRRACAALSLRTLTRRVSCP